MKILSNIQAPLKIISVVILLLASDTINGLDANEKANPRKKHNSRDSSLSIKTSFVILRLENGYLLKGNRKKIDSDNGDSKIVYEFLGLPFAQAPINEKRFQFPLKLEKIFTSLKSQNEPYDATYYRPSCIQEYDQTFPNFAGSEMWNPPYGISEDCLYFNIWVPVTESQDDILYKWETVNNLNNFGNINYIKDSFTKANVNKTLIFMF